jgi:hypothetical protein
MTRVSGDMALKTLLDELTYLRKTISGLTKGIRRMTLNEEYAENFRFLITVRFDLAYRTGGHQPFQESGHAGKFRRLDS